MTSPSILPLKFLKSYASLALSSLQSPLIIFSQGPTPSTPWRLLLRASAMYMLPKTTDYFLLSILASQHHLTVVHSVRYIFVLASRTAGTPSSPTSSVPLFQSPSNILLLFLVSNYWSDTWIWSFFSLDDNLSLNYLLLPLLINIILCVYKSQFYNSSSGFLHLFLPPFFPPSCHHFLPSFLPFFFPLFFLLFLFALQNILNSSMNTILFDFQIGIVFSLDTMTEDDLRQQQ